MVGELNMSVERYGIINNEIHCLLGDKRAIYKKAEESRASLSDK